MAVGHVSPAAELAALLVGGGLAATSHGMKSGGRILINTSPEPFSNWVASVGEDVVVVAGITAAGLHPGGLPGGAGALHRAGDLANAQDLAWHQDGFRPFEDALRRQDRCRRRCNG